VERQGNVNAAAEAASNLANNNKLKHRIDAVDDGLDDLDWA
jgi:hypothetical protein